MAISITTRLIMEAAERRGWKVVMLREANNLIQITDSNGRDYYLRNINSFKGGGVNTFLADKKHILYELVERANLATLPPSEIVTSQEQARSFLKQHGQVVVKPADQSHGNGVTVNVSSAKKLDEALKLAESFSANVLIQKQIIGDDYRLVFMGGKFVAAAIREPATVIGDGRHSIQELIELENQQSDRGKGYEKPKTRIDATSAREYLGEQLSDVPSEGEKVQVVGTANIGKGGVAIDVTDTIDPSLVKEATRLVEHFAIELAGIDYLVDANGTAYFIEVNTAPSLGLHAYPVKGRPRLLADNLLDWITSPS